MLALFWSTCWRISSHFTQIFDLDEIWVENESIEGVIPLEGDTHDRLKCLIYVICIYNSTLTTCTNQTKTYQKNDWLVTQLSYSTSSMTMTRVFKYVLV